MKPAPFEYAVPRTLDEALAALAESGGEAKLLAGGQSLVPILNFRLARPPLLIDINRIAGLADIRDDGDSIRIGALARHFAVETSPLMATHLPVVSAAMGHVAHLAIRNRGTIGGSLAHADPAAEWPMLALLLDAKLVVRSGEGSRTIAARDFFVSALTTSLAADEMLVEVELPKLKPREGWAFEEVARREGDFALAACGATVILGGDGAIEMARIAVMGVADTPLRIEEAEQLAVGRAPDAALLGRIADAIRTVVEPNTDLHASADYRRHLAGVLAQRVVAAAVRRAQAGGA